MAPKPSRGIDPPLRVAGLGLLHIARHRGALHRGKRRRGAGAKPDAAPEHAARGEAPASAFVSVECDGAQYSVSSEAEDLSSRSLSLISQLIGLQKEASEIPITAPIRLIGQ
jgi:hypothetical protein